MRLEQHQEGKLINSMHILLMAQISFPPNSPTLNSYTSILYDDKSIHFCRLQTSFGAASGLSHSSAVLKSVSIPFDEAVNLNTNKIPQSLTSYNAHKVSSQKSDTAKSIAKYVLTFVTIASAITAVSHPAAHAAKKAAAAAETVEHLHTGQKVANFFRSFGIPDLAVLAIISAMPVVELRGAVPVGVWMGLPITTILPVCVLGNMVPIVPLIFLLRNDKLK